jgi:hypothetical protein
MNLLARFIAASIAARRGAIIGILRLVATFGAVIIALFLAVVFGFVLLRKIIVLWSARAGVFIIVRAAFRAMALAGIALLGAAWPEAAARVASVRVAGLLLLAALVAIAVAFGLGRIWRIDGRWSAAIASGRITGLLVVAAPALATLVVVATA